MDTFQETTPSKKGSLVNKLIKVVLPLGLGVLILYFLFRDTNFEQMWGVVKDANWAILLFSLIFGILGNTIRGYRWKLLIDPLGYQPRVLNLIFAVHGSYAVNFAIPRGGEIWRCGVIAKEEKIPFSKLIGSMILDRVLDTLMVGLITLFAFLINMQFFVSYIKSNEAAFDSITNIFTSPYLYIGLLTIILVIYIIFKFFKENFLVKKALSLLLGFWHDLKVIWKMKQKIRLILYSFMIWGSYFLYFYTTFFAFGFTENLGITAGLIAFAISSVSMAIPTNGGMGAWHAAVIAALVIYGVANVQAEAFAFAVFTLQSIWVIFCGLVSIVAMPLYNRKK